MSHVFRPVAYVKEGCPYSAKFLDFVEDAHLTDRIDVVRCSPGSQVMQAVKRKLVEGTGRPAKFPTVEIEPGKFKSESDELIDFFRERYVDADE